MSGPEIRKQKSETRTIPTAAPHAAALSPSQPAQILPVPMSASGSASARVIMGAG